MDLENNALPSLMCLLIVANLVFLFKHIKRLL